ncbi:hypothetical protein H5T55_04650 [Candidatus Bipolaricaulota bacterium]|nr:hypothetical protein [Candidatus Bipolaricaulota bacterium]
MPETKEVVPMMKRVIGGLIVGVVLLGALGSAQGEVQLPPAEAEIAAMEVAFSQLSSFFAGLIAELKGAVSTLNEADASLAAQLQDLDGRISGQIAELYALAEALNETDQELALGITSLAQTLEKTRQEFASAIATLGEKVSDLTRQGAVHGDKIAALEGAALALQAQIEDCKTTLRAELRMLDGKFTADVVSLQGSIVSLTEEVSHHAARIAALESQDIGSLQRRMLALEQSIQALNIKIENNREKIALLEKAIGGFTSDLKTTIGALQARVDDHEARLEIVEATVVDLDVQALQDGITMAQGMAIVALLAGLAALVMALLGG